MCSDTDMEARGTKVDICECSYSKLRSFREKFDLGPNRLFRYMHYCGLIPRGSSLSVSRIESWYTRNAKSAIKEDLYAVLNAFEAICYETGINSNTQPKQLIALSESYQQELSSQLDRYRKFTLKAWLTSPECPKGMTYTLLNRLCSGKVKTLYAEQIKFVQTQLSMMVSF
jgi:hypothetical protein